MWNICHKSGRVVFTTVDEQTAMNRKQFGWRVEKVDRSREQFEESYSKLYGTPKSVLENLRQTHGDDYRETDGDRLSRSWCMWKASRAAIEIQLPERLEPTGYHIDEAYMVPDKDGEYLDRDAVIETLTENGLNVKEG